MDQPPVRPAKVVVHALLILILACGLRAAVWSAVSDGPLPYLHHWTESDMAFFRSWAREILAGDLLTERGGLPAHSWHDHVARRVHERSGSPEPYGDAVRVRYWRRWLGPGRFYQDPLYPYFLAAVWGMLGDGTGPIFLLQALMGIGTALLAWRIAWLLYDETVGLVAGILAALYGPLVTYESILLRCSMITFLGSAALLAGLLALRGGRGRILPAACGALCGLAVLLKSSAILFFAALVIAAAHRHRKEGMRALTSVAACLAGFALAVSPLVARNLALGVPPWSVSASGAVTFVNHNAVDYRAGMGDTLSDFADEVMEASDGKLLPAVAAAIRTHPSGWSWLRLAGGKLAAFWSWYEIPNNASYDYFKLDAGRAGRLFVGFALVGPLGLAGMLLGFRRSHDYALAVAPVASGLLLVAIFYNLGRFRVPVAIAMIPFAAFALVTGARWLRGGRWAPLGALAAVILASGLLVAANGPGDRPRIRLADYGVANEIALNVARQRLAYDDTAGALAILERQIRTEPRDLAKIRPGPEPGVLDPFSASLSGSYRPLHREAAEICRGMGDEKRARHHAGRARILGLIESQFRSRSDPAP